MSEMVERVTGAIFDASYIAENVDQEMAGRFARAAIKAMREPTAEMLHGEPCMAGGKSYLVPVMEIWPKMIDAALSEKS